MSPVEVEEQRRKRFMKVEATMLWPSTPMECVSALPDEKGDPMLQIRHRKAALRSVLEADVKQCTTIGWYFGSY